MSVFKATKKPVEIEAIKLTKDNIYDVRSFIDGSWPDLEAQQGADMWEGYEASVIKNGLKLMTLESDGQTQVADIGDYIIKGVQGEFYPCKPDIFKATYNWQCKFG